MEATINTDESRRLGELDTYEILDTPSEPEFDDIVLLASQICETPVALVSFVAGDRQWFKAAHGFGGTETPLPLSICAHGLGKDELLIIPDLRDDPRTAGNPLVTDAPNVRFYAGAPLRVASGETLGMVCALDLEPRPGGLSEAQREGLRALGRLVVSKLETRKLLTQRNALLAIGDRLRACDSIGEMTRTASEIVGTTLRLTRAGYGTVDTDTETVEIEPDWTSAGVTSIAGTHRFDDYGRLRHDLIRGDPLVIDAVTTDPRTAANPQPMLDLGIHALVNMPVRDRGRTVAVLIAQAGTERRWTVNELAFLRNVADRLEVGIARIRAEEQQYLLNQEIAHRLKNTLAMVQAIASQTLNRSTDRGPIETFERRLMALGNAHDVLMQQNWVSADMREVIAAAMAPFGEAHRIRIDGPGIALGSRAALSMALVVHELATNALKYGALAASEGRVAIRWRIEADSVVFDWSERGGAPATEPARRGFGSKLLGLGLVGTGRTELRYEQIGFSATMSAPLGEFTQI